MKQKLVTYRKPKLGNTAKQVSTSFLNSSSNAANKALQGLAAHQSDTNDTNNRYINIMEAQQDINFILASSHLMVRRMSRSNQEHERLVATGKADGDIRIAFGWIIDHSLFVLDLIWGVIQPILLILFMLIAALTLLIMALFRPTIPLKRGLHDYLFVVDVTQSMNTADMRINGEYMSRMAYTRNLLKKTISQLPCGTKVSLSVFSAESVALLFTPIEVCKNYDVIQDSVAHLEWRMAWRGNSRLRFGMQSVTAILSSLQAPAQVVFFTDGDEAPKLNATNKTDLSTWQGGHGWLIVGVGGDEPFPIPKLDSDNKILGYWAYSNSIMAPSQVISEDSVGTRDDSIATDDYNRYLSKLEGTYLQELSTEIGAKYSKATDAENLLNAMKAQKPAGYDTTRFPIDWLLILSAMCMVIAQYRRSLVIKFRSYFTTA